MLQLGQLLVRVLNGLPVPMSSSSTNVVAVVVDLGIDLVCLLAQHLPARGTLLLSTLGRALARVCCRRLFFCFFCLCRDGRDDEVHVLLLINNEVEVAVILVHSRHCRQTSRSRARFCPFLLSFFLFWKAQLSFHELAPIDRSRSYFEINMGNLLGPLAIGANGKNDPPLEGNPGNFRKTCKCFFFF